jgi:hypothetical protein
MHPRTRKCNTYVDQRGHKTFAGDAKDAVSSDAVGCFGTQFVAECAERHIHRQNLSARYGLYGCACTGWYCEHRDVQACAWAPAS